MNARLALLTSALCLAGCSLARPAQEVRGPTSLVDAQIPAAPADVSEGWAYRLSAQADLDGDGTPERVAVLADVGLDAGGEPVWDDGQAWEVRVEEADGTRTRLYARFIQLGELEARIVEAGGGLAVGLVEKTAERETAFVVRYGGPGEVVAVETAAPFVESRASEARFTRVM